MTLQIRGSLMRRRSGVQGGAEAQLASRDASGGSIFAKMKTFAFILV